MGAVLRCYGFRAKAVAGDERSEAERLYMTIFPNVYMADTFFEMREMEHQWWERVELRVEIVEPTSPIDS